MLAITTRNQIAHPDNDKIDDSNNVEEGNVKSELYFHRTAAAVGQDHGLQLLRKVLPLLHPEQKNMDEFYDDGESKPPAVPSSSTFKGPPPSPPPAPPPTPTTGTTTMTKTISRTEEQEKPASSSTASAVAAIADEKELYREQLRSAQTIVARYSSHHRRRPHGHLHTLHSLSSSSSFDSNYDDNSNDNKNGRNVYSNSNSNSSLSLGGYTTSSTATMPGAVAVVPRNFAPPKSVLSGDNNNETMANNGNSENPASLLALMTTSVSATTTMNPSHKNNVPFASWCLSHEQNSNHGRPEPAIVDDYDYANNYAEYDLQQRCYQQYLMSSQQQQQQSGRHTTPGAHFVSHDDDDDVVVVVAQADAASLAIPPAAAVEQASSVQPFAPNRLSSPNNTTNIVLTTTTDQQDERQKDQRRMRYLVLGVTGCLLILAAVMIGYLVRNHNANSNNSNSNNESRTSSSSPTDTKLNGLTLFNSITTNCELLPHQPHPHFISQCHCDGTISKLPTDIVNKYNLLATTFIPYLLPDFEQTISSCHEQNQALVWLASSDGITTGASSTTDTTLRQRYLLALLYIAWNGIKWPSQPADGNFGSISSSAGATWLSSNYECTWTGITCSDEGSDVAGGDADGGGGGGNDIVNGKGVVVTGISISNNIHKIPTEMGLLSHLQSITLSSTGIEGTLPLELFHENSPLQTLVLTDNQITGSIPTQIGNLQQLRTLRLSGNMLFGSIPAEICRCSTLSQFHVDHNHLQGDLPSCFHSMSQLASLCLTGNSFNTSTTKSLSINCSNTEN